MRSEKKKIIITIILAAAALISLFFLSSFLSSDRVLTGTYEYLDGKRNQVLGLAGSTTTASIIAGAIPGDATTGIATALGSLAKTCIVVLAAVFAERYLASLFVKLAFTVLIPLACLIGIGALWIHKEMIRSIALKLAIFGIVLSLIVPVSTVVSRQIEQISGTDEQVEQVEENTEEDTGKDDEEEKNWLSKITSKAESTIDESKEEIKDSVNQMIEKLAVMLVTACLIPVLVFVFLLWLARLLFQIDLPSKARHEPENTKHPKHTAESSGNN